MSLFPGLGKHCLCKHSDLHVKKRVCIVHVCQLDHEAISYFNLNVFRCAHSRSGQSEVRFAHFFLDPCAISLHSHAPPIHFALTC